MIAVENSEFVYRLKGRVSSTTPGSHRSNSRGAGMNFVSHAKLFDQPDPRRLDLRASISSIQKDWLVRVNQQHATITVSAIVDVSPSMHFGVSQSKLQVAAEFLQALGNSTGGLGDSVSLQCFDSSYREDLNMPPRFGRGIGSVLAEQLQTCSPSSPDAASIDALSQCIESVASNTALVFIVSDFHWPLEQLANRLDPLSGASIVPLVIWDHAEIHPPEGKRLLSVRQMGATGSRHMWLTPSVREQWKANVQKRQDEISDAFASRDITPFLITNGFDAEALSRYFMESAT